MAKQLESSVEAALVRYAAKRGVLTFKFSSPSHRGVPDRIFMANGNVLFLEVKRPGGEPTALQTYTMRAITNAGCLCRWVDNVEAGKGYIDGLLSARGCSCLSLL